ncbi:putative RNA-directed DNA polymerase, eukaryota, reverse transcriptase zinc-binding domain protein [Tanacetum coccineum]
MKCTSAIRQLAYAIVPDFLDKYLQISPKSSRLSLDHFCTSIMEISGPEYLRKPTMTDVVKLYRQYEEKHGFSGWDAKAEDGLINDFDVDKREEWIMDLDHLNRLHKEDLKQKCRLKWAVEGDENTNFFHSLLKVNYSRSNIKGIISDGIWRVDPDSIKHTDFKHFSSRFQECGLNRPSFSSTRLHPLSAMDTDSLEMSFSLDEVKEAVWGCAGSKASGPDGFNFNFIKAHWDIIKQELWDYIKPISLIGCAYKVISKVLANRLSKVIGSIISPNQSAFIAGRQILDGCLIANEVIRMSNIEKLKLLLFKVDFEKAFDSANWEFLLDIMRQMGFRHKWRRWIVACLSSTSISILINGSPSKEFKLERGLRQGDHLSPFLFLIVVEALQVTILEACDKGLYKGVFLAENGSNLSLIQYADDALFFGE